MKSRFLFLLLLLSGIASLNAQVQLCPFGPTYENQLLSDSLYRHQVEGRFAFLHSVSGSQITTQSSGPLVIPVVVHVMHLASESYGQGHNISYAQVLSQIDRLNADFANDTIYTQLPSGHWAQNTGIQFCLARTPIGPSQWSVPAEPGVMRYAVGSSVLDQIWDYSNQSTVNAMLAVTHPSPNYFPFDRFLNIWTVNQVTDGGNAHFAGYSPEPVIGAPFPLDGIVMDVHMFGDNTVNNNNFTILNPNYNTGNILAHETGHYLDLFHTFTGGCAGMTNSDCQTSGDFICDTPPNTNTTGSCNQTATCNENITPWGNRPDMVENYMTWADDNCLNTFTYEQGLVMRNYVQYFRSTLIADTNLAITGVAGLTGCLPPILTADFISPINFCINQTITFQAYAGPGFANNQFQWSFANAIPTTSSSQNPSVLFTASGPQQVTLTVTDTATGFTDVVQQWVYVSPCASLASTMGSWYFGKNAGISFATGTGQTDNAAFLNHSMNTIECVVSVSDTAGTMLFMSDGDTIWDRNHQPVVTTLQQDSSNSKSQIIYAPHPLHPNWYYIFHSPAYENGLHTISYTIVADSNSTMVPIVINDTVARAVGLPGFGELITAVPHCNGRDTWIIASGRFQPGNYNNTAIYQRRLYVFLVSPAGVTGPNGSDPHPYMYTLTSLNNSGYEFYGEMKASADGTKIALTKPNAAVVVSFDPATGILSGDHVIPATNGFKYGLSFSPNGHNLYITDQNSQSIEGADITVSNPSFSIVATGTTTRGGLQLGPDSMLYAIHDGIFGTTIDRFTNPNNLSNPGYTVNALTLNSTYGTIRSLFGLPNFIEARRPATTPLSFTVQMNSCNSASFNFPGCWSSGYHFHWNFGDNATDTTQSPSHTYSAPGTYTVTLAVTIGSFSYNMSSTVNVMTSAPAISGPTTFCSGSFAQVQYTLPPGFTYVWTTSGGGNIIGPNTTSSVLVAWSASGSINCVVNNGPSCQFNVTLPVSYFQSPVVSAGPDTVVSCLNSVVPLGGSPTAIGGQPPYTYQWLPASQLNNATSSNPICTLTTSTTYSVVVTDQHGCTGSDVTTVVVDSSISAPQVVFNVPSDICDFTSTLNLPSYAAPLGGSFSGPGVSGNTFSPSAAGGPGSYEVTYFITGSNGCMTAAVDTLKVIQCCQAPNAGITTLDQQGSQQYGAQFSTTPVPVRINGTFYIDNNFNITNFNGVNSVRCAPGATIIVKPGARLTIQVNSLLQACSNGMWTGIIVMPGGELIIETGSEIRDAITPVVSQNGAKFTLDRAILRNNYKNIVVEPYTGQGLHPGTVVRSSILGATSLALPPYAGQKTYSGYEVTGVDSIYLGVATTPTDENQFRNMYFGVEAHNSKVYVQNNSFTAISSSSIPVLPGCCLTNTCQNNSVCNPPPKGTDIWADGGTIIIGGPTTASQNRFSSSTRGVLAENSIDATIMNNQFDGITPASNFLPSYCVTVRRCKSNKVVITNNTMYNIKNGIVFGFSNNTKATIENNTIYNYGNLAIQVLQTKECPVSVGYNSINVSTYASSSGKCSIRVSNAVITNNTTYVRVHGNITKLSEKHIWVTSFPYIEIDSSNSINFPNGVPVAPRYGIQVQNSSYALVEGNTVTMTPGLPIDTNYRKRLYGISMETNCFNSEVSNNGVVRMGTGIQYFNTNNYPSTISCNQLTNNMRGVLLNNTYVGDQGSGVTTQNPNGLDQDNYWTIAPAQSGLYKAIWGINTPSGTHWYYRANNTNLNPGPGFMQPFFVVTFSGPQPNAPNLCMTGCASCNKQANIALVIGEEPPYDTSDYTARFVSEQSAYEQLRRDSSLLSMGTAYDSLLTAFYNEQRYSNIGLIDEVYQKASEGDASAAAAAKDGIDPRGTPDENHKLVAEIYLRSWAIDQLYFTPEDSATLYGIAMQNVTYGGTAVYDARVMLDLDGDDFSEGASARMTGHAAEELSAGTLYPNPTTGAATYQIELKEGETGVLVIKDLFGRTVISQKLVQGENVIQIDMTELPSGLYLYQAIINEETRQTGKIILSK